MDQTILSRLEDAIELAKASGFPAMANDLEKVFDAIVCLGDALNQAVDCGSIGWPEWLFDRVDEALKKAGAK